MPARDPWQTRPKTRVVLAASARTPVCFRAVRALTRGGVLTRAQSISRNCRICARFPRVGQRHPPCPSTGRGSDRPRQPAARTSSFDRVWRWPTSGEWRSCRSARDGGTPGENERRGNAPARWASPANVWMIASANRGRASDAAAASVVSKKHRPARWDTSHHGYRRKYRGHGCAPRAYGAELVGELAQDEDETAQLVDQPLSPTALGSPKHRAAAYP